MHVTCGRSGGVSPGDCGDGSVSSELAVANVLHAHSQKSRTFEPAYRHAAYSRKTEKPIWRPKRVQFPWSIINS